MPTKVLMLGPGDQMVGGIRSLVDVIVPELRCRVDLQYLPTVSRRAPSDSGKMSARNVGIAMSQYVRFGMALARFRPQVIHIHSSEGLAWMKDTFYVCAGKMCGCKVVLHMHGGTFVERYRQSRPIAQSYTRLVLALTDQIIEVSKGRAESLARVVPRSQIGVFRNCVSAPPLDDGATRDNAAQMRVLFLGTVGENKGAFDLLEAAALAKSKRCSFALYMAGPPEQPGDLEKARNRSGELGLTDWCQIVGPVHGYRKSQLLDHCNVFALPSYREAMPIAILEAMAAGMPIVATKVGGVCEIVADGYNGFLIAPGDIEALADRLVLLAAHPELRHIMGQRGREIVRRQFDAGTYVDRLAALYESIVNAERTSSRQVPV